MGHDEIKRWFRYLRNNMYTGGSTQGNKEVLTNARDVSVIVSKGQSRPLSGIIRWGRCVRVGDYCDSSSVVLFRQME